jgi:hypothetical protein
MLGRFDRLRRDEFELDEAEFERLRGDVARWRERAVELQRTTERAHERNRGRER